MKTITINLVLIITLSCYTCIGQIYISDAGNFDKGPYAIYKFDADGKNGKVFITEKLAWPQDILFLENEKVVLISNLSTGTIDRYDINSGSFISTFASGIGGPTRMKIGPDKKIYVLQWEGNGKVKRYDPDGTFLGDFTKTGVTNSIGLDWDKNGNLYVSSYNGKFVQKFNEKGESQGKIVSGVLDGPTNIYFDGNGHLLVLDYNSGRVLQFDEAGKFIKELIKDIGQCEGISFLQNGNFLIGVGSTSSIHEYDKNGSFIGTLIASGSLGLLSPNAVVIRNASTALNEVATSDNLFALPLTNNSFTIKKEIDGSILESISVYTLAGKLLTVIPRANNLTWSAETLNTGIYILVANTNSGNRYKQKIYVQQ